MKNLLISSYQHNYNVILDNSLEEIISKFLDEIKKYFIIIDDKLLNKYSSLIERMFPNAIVYPLKGGEEAKSLETYEKVTNELLKCKISKSDILVAFGGGTIGDLTGYVASTYKRGLSYINIPTTVLSMVDSSIGGKTALNIGNIKNSVGTFYPPEKVFIGLDTLETLSDREFNNGLFESLKMAMLSDKELYEIFEKGLEKQLINEVIERSLIIKKHFIESDEKDIGIRHALNFGHTFGHAIEEESEYSLKHGEAIANGLLIASKGKEYFSSLESILIRMNCPIYKQGNLNKLITLIENDKKKTNERIDFITVPTIGTFEINSITIDEIIEVAKYYGF